MTTVPVSRPQQPIRVDSGARIPAGGAVGDALLKTSGRDYETVWGRQTVAASWGDITGVLQAQSDLQAALDALQPELISGTTIKTVNGTSLLGSGNIVISGGATNLSYTAATRILASDTGTDATLPLVSTGDAGLAPASGGGTANFLRADGTWAAPGGGGATNLTYTAATGVVASDTGTDATITLADGTNRGLMASADFTKLAGIASGAQVNVATDLAYTAATRLLASSTGVDATLPLADGTDAGLMASADFTKLAGIASGATANSADATLLARANHTGTQAASTVSNFNEAAQDAVGAMVGVSLVYDDTGATLQRAALTGAVTSAQNSNAVALGSFTKAELDAAVSDDNVAFAGDAPTAHTHPQSDVTDLVSDLAAKQATLVSATNIKTINGASVLGAGDLTVSSAVNYGLAIVLARNAFNL